MRRAGTVSRGAEGEGVGIIYLVGGGGNCHRTRSTCN
jgi:hypothetical protein